MVPTRSPFAASSGILNAYGGLSTGALLGPLMISVKVPKPVSDPALRNS